MREKNEDGRPSSNSLQVALETASGPPGFKLQGSISIEPYLPAGCVIKPTLCFSDTHFLPAEKSFGVDAVDEVVELLVWFHKHQVFILGDFIESLILTEGELKSLPGSKRFFQLFRELRWRSQLRVIPGNHDIWATRMLRKRFGSTRFFPGGFRVSNLVFVHGHETGLDSSPVAERIPSLISLGANLKTLGLRPKVGVASNLDIACQYFSKKIYPIFGHTHMPEANKRFANTGCFLKSDRSFITLEGIWLKLWKYS